MIKLDQNTDNVMLIWKDQFQRTKEEVEEGHNGHALRLMEEIKEQRQPIRNITATGTIRRWIA